MSLSLATIPVIGFVAPSGTGKTTLLATIIPLLKEKGLHIGVIKNTHHNFEIDKPGKDSYVLQQAGAEQMIIASKQHWALMVKTPPPEGETSSADVDLNSMIQHFDQTKLDLILVEGFKYSDYPKIELHRSEKNLQPLFLSDSNIIAVASNNLDSIINKKNNIPILDLNKPNEIVEFIITMIQSTHNTSTNEAKNESS